MRGDASWGVGGRCERGCSLVTPGIVVGLVAYGLGVVGAGAVLAPWPGDVWVPVQVLPGMLVGGLAALTLAALGRTVFTDPGTPPPAARWLELPAYRGRPLEAPSRAPAARETSPPRLLRAQRAVRWCRHCQTHKPDRTHHCRVTHQCVLRFDHYCPWVSQPVGWHNHKYFFLFTFWCAWLCAVALGTLLLALSVRVGWNFEHWGALEVQMAVVIFMCFLFALTLFGFSGMHAWLLLRNQTTLEQMKNDRRWDLGSAQLNWRQLFGSRRATWFLPVPAENVGPGLEFGPDHDNPRDDADAINNII